MFRRRELTSATKYKDKVPGRPVKYGFCALYQNDRQNEHPFIIKSRTEYFMTQRGHCLGCVAVSKSWLPLMLMVVVVSHIIQLLLRRSLSSPGTLSSILLSSFQYSNGMPAIPSFINSYKPGRKAKAAIKSSLSRFNRSEPSTNPQPDIPPDLGSPAVSAIIDIKDDRSSLDFDGGQPDEYTSDLVDAPSPAPAKLEITLPPELRIDWFAERQAAIDANRLDQDTKDTLAGKVKDDHGLVETLEDALARHVDSNVSLVLIEIPSM